MNGLVLVVLEGAEADGRARAVLFAGGARAKCERERTRRRRHEHLARVRTLAAHDARLLLRGGRSGTLFLSFHAYAHAHA